MEAASSSSSDWGCSPALEALLRALPVVDVDPSTWPVCVTSDSDWEDKFAEEIFFLILGLPRLLINWKNAKVTKYNKIFLEHAFKNAAKYEKAQDDYRKKILEVNLMLIELEKFDYMEILPRSPSPRPLHTWYRAYRMSRTDPTSVKCKRYTEPGVHEYDATCLLQFFSLNFSGDFLSGKPLSIYGFVAVRDDVDKLRNYVFNRSRKDAHEICPDSTALPLFSPSRGISANYEEILVEYSLKVKKNDTNCTEEDTELIDGCFLYRHANMDYNCLRDVRLYGPFGPVDIRFVSLARAVEASIDVEIKRAAKGYNLNAVTAFVDYPYGIVLYDRSASPEEDGFRTVAVKSSVVAVKIRGKLLVKFDVSIEDDRGCQFHEAKGTVETHELSFTPQKYGSTKGALVIGGMLELEVEVTWSTVGKPIFNF